MNRNINKYSQKLTILSQTSQPANPFEEEKAEARSGSSTGGNSPASDTPHASYSTLLSNALHPPQARATRVPKINVTISTARADSLLFALAEPKLHVSR